MLKSLNGVYRPQERGMDRAKLEEKVTRELEALRERIPLLSDGQLSGLLTFLRAVVPEREKPILM
jgi:hypothetical protein